MKLPMKKLIKGIIDFRQKSLADYRAKFSTLALGQFPDTLFIACCDSRVVPNTFASSDPGDLFVVRNIGNLVPPYQDELHSHHDTAAAIEYSVQFLHVSDIVICGHSECGAMRPFFENNTATKLPLTENWLKYAEPAYHRYLNHAETSQQLTPHNVLSQCNVIQQIEHLKTYPWIHEQLHDKKISLHGWWFDLATADVHYYNNQTKSFILIDEESENIFATL